MLGLVGLLIFYWLVMVLVYCMNVVCSELCIRKWVSSVQFCLVFIVSLVIVVKVVVWILVLVCMISGDLFLSFRCMCFRVVVVWDMMLIFIVFELVNEIMFICGLLFSRVFILVFLVMIFSMFLGRLVFLVILLNSSVEQGVNGDGLSIRVLFVSSVGNILVRLSRNGKLQLVMLVIMLIGLCLMLLLLSRWGFCGFIGLGCMEMEMGCVFRLFSDCLMVVSIWVSGIFICMVCVMFCEQLIFVMINVMMCLWCVIRVVCRWCMYVVCLVMFSNGQGL